MNVNRRSILKGMAAAPAALAIPAMAAPAIASTTATEAAAAVVNKHPWQWWVSFNDGDEYTETFATREQAVEFARNEGGGLVAECRHQDFDLRLDASEILDLLFNANEDKIGDGDFFDCTAEQAKDLERVVAIAMQDWATRHKIDLQAWIFGEVRNEETITELLSPNDRGEA